MRKYNLVVVGGGLSGVAASISAAREGLDVLLIERSGSLGGAISNNLVFPFMKFWEFDKDAKIKRFINNTLDALHIMYYLCFVKFKIRVPLL